MIRIRDTNYQIEVDGRVWSNISKRYLRPIMLNGYPRVTLVVNDIKEYTRIHRLMALAFLPNPDNYPQVNHLDGDKTNNELSNLEWCNNSQNLKHAYAIGLHKPSYKRLSKGGNETH